MKEIKFRVFDTKEKIMITHFKGARIDYALHYWETHKHVSEPMQYTGLKDKNGVEIYEGDILQNTVWVGKEKPKNRALVSYNSSGFIGHTTGYEYSNDLYSMLDDWEVIGNIYENSGLLQ